MSITQYAYIIINAGIAVFCIIKGYYVFTNRAKSPGLARPLLGLMIVYALVSILELMSYAIIGNTSHIAGIVARASALVSYGGLFVTIIFASFFMYRLIDIRGGTRRPRLEKATVLFCLIGIIMLLISRIAGLYYYYDAQNVYHSTSSYSIHMLLALVAMAPVTRHTIKNRQVFHNREFVTVFTLLMGICVLTVMAMIMMIITQSNMMDNIAILMVIAVFAIIFRMEISSFIVVREGMELTGPNIDLVSEDMARFMDEYGLSSRNAIKARLKMEESLLRMRDRYGDDAKINFYATYLLRRPIVRIEITDEPFNPLSRSADDEIEDWSAGLLNSTGISPTYSYFLGKNQVKLAFPPRRMNSSIKMFIMALVGIVIGFGCTKALPESGAKIISEELLIPSYDLLANMMYCVSAPIIFFMIITAVLNTGAISDQGGSSSRLVFRYFVLSSFIGLFALVFSFLFGGGKLAPLSASELWKHDVIDAILSIVPRNILDPIKEVNSLQLMLMALVIGCAVIALGQKGKSLAELLRQCNLVAMKVAEWIGRLIPYFVTLVVVLILIMGQLGSFVTIVWTLLIAAFIAVFVAAVTIGYVAIKSGTRFTDLVLKCWPSFKIALKTGSANEAYEESERCCSEELGIERHYAAEGLPLGTIMYMPINVAAALVYVVLVAIKTDVPITPVWIVMAIILTVLLIVATPPIPGANFLPYMIIISQLGIENRYLIGALLFDVLIGSLAVAVNQIMLQMELTIQANKIGLIKKDRLKSSTR